MNHSATSTNFFKAQPTAAAFLPAQFGRNRGRKTLVLDLDETLVHSSFQPVQHEDLVLPVLFFLPKTYRLILKGN